MSSRQTSCHVRLLMKSTQLLTKKWLISMAEDGGAWPMSLLLRSRSKILSTNKSSNPSSRVVDEVMIVSIILCARISDVPGDNIATLPTIVNDPHPKLVYGEIWPSRQAFWHLSFWEENFVEEPASYYLALIALVHFVT